MVEDGTPATLVQAFKKIPEVVWLPLFGSTCQWGTLANPANEFAKV
jgi:ABC-type nitrate/sulfonate/bicarbonate transport system permease component